jgi:arylsulfatase A-like enzyme
LGASRTVPQFPHDTTAERLVMVVAATGFTFLLVTIGVGLLVPQAAARDPRLTWSEVAALISAEFLLGLCCIGALAMVAALCSQAAISFRLPNSFRRIGTAALRIGVLAVAFCYLASWALFWAIGTFVDLDVLEFADGSSQLLAQHVLAMNPAVMLAVPVSAAAAVVAIERIPRGLARGSNRGVRVQIAGLAGAAIVAVALWVRGEIVLLSNDGLLRDQEGALVARSNYLREARMNRTGPLLHVLEALGTRASAGGENDMGSSLPHAIRGVIPVEERPQVSVQDWVAGIDRARVQQWNVVVLLVESLRPDALRAFGGARDVMPEIDALARQSLRFPVAYSQATHSNYADLCPLSSQYPFRQLSHHQYPPQPDYPRVLLHDILRALDYRTAVISSQNENWGGMANYLNTGGLEHFFHSPTAGVATVVDDEDTSFAGWVKSMGMAGKIDDRVTVDEAIRWIGSSDRPFFVYMNLQNSHFPYRVPDGFPERFSPHEVDFPFAFGNYPSEKVPLVVNRYHNSLAYVDAQVGRLLAFLRTTGRLDRTIFVVSGDTGQAFYEHGFAGHAGPLLEEVIRVPLAIHVPGRQSAEVHRLAQHVDVPPTVLSLLGLPAFPGFQGTDLLAPDAPANTVYLTVQTPRANQVGIIRDGWKLVFDYDRNRYLLYDLRTDPGERRDRSGVEHARLDLLRARLQAWVDAQLGYYRSSAAKHRFYPPVVPNP